MYGNIAFTAVENPYFLEWVNYLRPSYTTPSSWVISHSLLTTEVARVQLEEIEYLKDRKLLTLLIDGWEDLLRRSLYGSVASELKREPVVLSLEDMTGKRGNADAMIESSQKALKAMELEACTNIIAVTTDNPTVMRSFRKKFEAIYTWVLVRSCLFR